MKRTIICTIAALLTYGLTIAACQPPASIRYTLDWMDDCGGADLDPHEVCSVDAWQAAHPVRAAIWNLAR